MDSGARGIGGGTGGGGGGKIPTRFCHQGPTEPYQQGQQRPQSILSRVTDSVKNIVPRWLLTYFSRDEGICSCSTDRSQAPLLPENREDDHVINADEESTNIHEGRLTPEPTVSNTEEPLDSAASHCQQVIMRSSIHRSHLKFSMLESPALHCQPSTSSAFPMSSSGFFLIKKTKNSTSQYNDGNISTTSGIFSRASAKDTTASKNTSVPHPLFRETEYHSLPWHTATSFKTLAFNVSVFKRYSQSIGKSSILKTSELGNAPFNPVKTQYVGAAGFIKEPKVLKTPPYQEPVRVQMRAKQLKTQKQFCGVTSLQARRILQSLETLSSSFSPLDRSRIITTIDYWAKRQKVDSQYPVQKVMTRKPVSITGNRTAYFQSSLTTSGELKKTNQRTDKKHSIGFKFSAPVEKMAEPSGSRTILEPTARCSHTTSSKNTSVPYLWSVETEHHSLSQDTATSPGKPAHNVSAFGTLSPSIGKSSILKTSQLEYTHSYPVKTMYGGAAAPVRKTKIGNTTYQVPVRIQMKAKQLSTQSCDVASLRARRILQSLKTLSSPFLPPDRNRIITTTDHWAKRQKQYSTAQRLMNRKAVSIAGNQTVYFKPSLTPSDELKKTNQRIDKKLSSGSEKNTTPEQKREQQESSVSYQNCSTPAVNVLSSGAHRGGGKMKRERMHFVATKSPEEEETQVPVLPRITLPITSSSLPFFNFSSSVATSPSPIGPAQSLTNKIGFTFSVLIAKTVEPSGFSSISEPITSSSDEDITAVKNSRYKKQLDEDCESPVRPAIILKEGSVLDVLKNADQGSANPVFSLPNETSFNSSPPAPSATGSTFGSSTPSSWAPVAAQAKPAATSSMGTAVTPCVSGSGVLHNNSAWSGISFGATTTPRAADFSFVIDTGPSVPSVSPALDVNQTPTFGQNQGASWLNPPVFGSLSPSAALFSAGSQPGSPTLGTVSSGSQTPVLGQQPVESALGTETAPNSGEQNLEPSVKGSQHFTQRPQGFCPRSP